MSESDDENNQSAESLLKILGIYCSLDSLSEEDLRGLIEHVLTSINSHDVDDYTFFLKACINESVTEGIIRCLIEYFPDAASATTDTGATPLHYACFNKSATRGIIELLIDAAPDSVGSVTNLGMMPLHYLCANKEASEATLIEILKFLIEKCPAAVQHADNYELPIHVASTTKSPEFCQVLIDAYPGSERIASDEDDLPLHIACRCNAFATVEYLYKLYPDAVNHASTEGFSIHCAIESLFHRSNQMVVVEIVHFLLDCDPNVKLQKFEGESLLHYACKLDYYDSNIDAGIEVIKVIYDAHPEAIEENRFVSDIQRYHQRVQSFVRSELVYAHQAKDLRLMMTPDDYGQLPLHTALQNNVRLGSIKLLVKGNPSAIRTLENNFALPLHIACEHHDSASVVEYLLDLDRRTLRAVDIDNNTALHYACRGAKYDTIALLLDKYDAASVSKRNANGKIPIDLLWESNAVGDRESVDYTESVFRLLKAYPETVVLNCSDEMNQHGTRDDWSAQNGKKRKLGAA